MENINSQYTTNDKSVNKNTAGETISQHNNQPQEITCDEIHMNSEVKLFNGVTHFSKTKSDTYNTHNTHNTPNNLFSYELSKPEHLAPKISLNSKEEEIFNIIKSVLKKHNKSTVCRVAGGWVRDKLLGRRNDDIDIALDDMSGGVLAKMVNDELYPGQEKFGVVSQNCEKSKHLETATMKICDSFVDFVNLRSETYTENSRVPQIEIGTPEEDARRRDITINSMFYNINTNQVEDFLQMGVSDLAEGYIRTPLDPEVTFADDPLRLLRVVRFAVRFQFALDPMIEHAAKKEEIKSALHKKISNERISKELCLMLEGNKPHCALFLLHQFNLIDAVFKLPLNNSEIESNLNADSAMSINYLLLALYMQEHLSLPEDNKFHSKHVFRNEDKDCKKIVYFSLLTAPFRNYYNKVGKDNVRASVQIVKDSLKLPNDYIRETSILHDNLEVCSKWVNNQENQAVTKESTFNNGNNSTKRLYLGKLVRKIKSNLVPKLFLLCICHDYLMQVNPEGCLSEINMHILNEIIEKYNNTFAFIEKENLLHADILEPLIKGDKMTELLKVRGKEIGVLVEHLIENQITNPQLTPEEAYDLIRKKKEELVSTSAQPSPNKSKKNK